MNQHIFEIKKRETPYVIMDKGFLNNPDLTMQAKGLLAYLISLPKDWKIYRSELVKRFANGEKALRSTISELIGHGYMFRYQIKDEKSRFGRMVYLVFESPELRNKFASLIPPSEKPRGGKTHSDSAPGGKRQLPIKYRQNKEVLTNQSNISLMTLKKELEEYGWIGDVGSLVDKAGNIDAALYFWAQLKPLLLHVSAECRGGFISNRFASEAKQAYIQYLRQKEQVEKEKLDAERKSAEVAAQKAAEELEEEKLLQNGKNRWDSLPLSERINLIDKYCRKKDFTKDIFAHGFNLKTGLFTSEIPANLIYMELGEIAHDNEMRE